MTATEQLYQALTPERLDDYRFRSIPGPSHIPHIFGGETLAQSLSAATRTVQAERYAHSLHAYFLRAGDNRKPVDFSVQPLRDGGSFSTRQIVAMQDDKAIFNASISFKVAEEGVSHQPLAPDLPDPDSLQSDAQRRKARGGSEAYAERDLYSAFDFRTVGPLPDEYRKGDDETQRFWVKTTAPVADSLLMQQCLLAYLSDIRLMVTAMKPHGIRFWDSNVQSASLDHSLWFHHPFKFDGWLCYDQTGAVSADARGLNYGRFYDSSGQIIASSVQEGLMRLK